MNGVLGRAAAALAVMAGLCLQAFGQEADQTVPPYRLLTALEMAGVPASGAAEDGEIWRISLDAAVGRSPRISGVLRADAGGDRNSQAVLEACRVILEVSVAFNTETDSARAAYRILDVLSGSVLAEGVTEGPVPDRRELFGTFWLPLVSDLDRVRPFDRLSILRVFARPGTRITGLGPEPLRVGDGGEASVALRLPGTYAWRAVSGDGRTEKGIVAAFQEEQELHVPYRPRARWTVETGLLMGQFPDIHFGYNPIRERVFLRLGIQQYLYGLYLPSAEEGSSEDTASLTLPMLMPTATAGLWLGSTGSFVRPYLSASLFLRQNLDLAMLDPLAPLGATLCLGFDWRAARYFSAFFEIGGTMYPGSEGLLMAASKGDSESGPLGFVYSEDFFAEFPSLRLGVRMFL